jgi:hypothetical protein
MPDLTLCKGENCPQKNDCLRFRAKPDLLQYYFNEVPYQEEFNMCDEFIQVEWHDEQICQKCGLEFLNDSNEEPLTGMTPADFKRMRELQLELNIRKSAVLQKIE